MNDSKEWLVPIGERIKLARKELNMSQVELAEKANISVPHLSNIEMGKSDFGICVFIRISEALQISTDKLIMPQIPESTLIAAEKFAQILEGCTPSETIAILETAQKMKKAFNDAKKR